MAQSILDLNSCNYENVCYTCLIYNKKILCYNKYSNVYQILAHNLDNKITDEFIYICMECSSVVENFIILRDRAVKSYNIMSLRNNMSMDDPGDPLSDQDDSVAVRHAAQETPVDLFHINIDTMKQIKDEDVTFDTKTEEAADIADIKILPTIKQEIDETRQKHTRLTRKSSRLKASSIKKTEPRKQSLRAPKINYSDKFTLRRLSEDEMLAARANERKNKQNKRAFWCESCILTYSNECELTRHNETYHVEKKNHERCPICQQYVVCKHIVAHTAEHYTTYVCNTCGDSIYNIKCRSYHYEMKHRQRVFTCRLCQENFMTYSTLKHHKAKVHSDDYNCEYCGKVFSLKANYKMHLRIHTDKTTRDCEICNKQLKTKHYQIHMKLCHPKETDTKPYCAECNKHFKNLSTYKSHINKSMNHVSRDDWYACNECEKRFLSKSWLNNHINEVHLKVKRKCKVCGEMVLKVRAHKKHVHGIGLSKKIKNHVCDHCGKAFYNKIGLVDHMRTHTGERPYVCELCNSNFGYKSALYTHRKLVHKIRRWN